MYEHVLHMEYLDPNRPLCRPKSSSLLLLDFAGRVVESSAIDDTKRKEALEIRSRRREASEIISHASSTRYICRWRDHRHMTFIRIPYIRCTHLSRTPSRFERQTRSKLVHILVHGINERFVRFIRICA